MQICSRLVSFFSSKILYSCFSREMHNVFNHLLAALCIADLFFLGGNIVLTPIALGRPDIFNPGNFHPLVFDCYFCSLSSWQAGYLQPW